jgi:hypothetical protein
MIPVRTVSNNSIRPIILNNITLNTENSNIYISSNKYSSEFITQDNNTFYSSN